MATRRPPGSLQPPAGPDSTDMMGLLRRAAGDDGDAPARVGELFYDALHEMARRQMARERQDHTLQATALAHEVWLEIMGDEHQEWRSRKELLGLASTVMQRFLIDHARRKHTIKQGGRSTRVPFDYRIEALTDRRLPPEELIDLDDALERLGTINERGRRVVEMRFFLGMTIADVAHTLGVSRVTIENDYRYARAWLLDKLGWSAD